MAEIRSRTEARHQFFNFEESKNTYLSQENQKKEVSFLIEALILKVFQCYWFKKGTQTRVQNENQNQCTLMCGLYKSISCLDIFLFDTNENSIYTCVSHRKKRVQNLLNHSKNPSEILVPKETLQTSSTTVKSQWLSCLGEDPKW